jgi:hypothetical protein
MIDYADVLPLLIAVCRTYRGSMEETMVDHENGEYVQIGYFAAHLIRLLDEGATEDFPAVFGVIESILKEGDADARSLVGDGLLDDLTNPGLYEGDRARPIGFLPWLGTRTRSEGPVRALLEERFP